MRQRRSFDNDRHGGCAAQRHRSALSESVRSIVKDAFLSSDRAHEGETLSKLSFADVLVSGGSRNFKPPKPLQVVLTAGHGVFEPEQEEASSSKLVDLSTLIILHIIRYCNTV